MSTEPDPGVGSPEPSEPPQWDGPEPSADVDPPWVEPVDPLYPPDDIQEESGDASTDS